MIVRNDRFVSFQVVQLVKHRFFFKMNGIPDANRDFIFILLAIRLLEFEKKNMKWWAWEITKRKTFKCIKCGNIKQNHHHQWACGSVFRNVKKSISIALSWGFFYTYLEFIKSKEMSWKRRFYIFLYRTLWKHNEFRLE